MSAARLGSLWSSRNAYWGPVRDPEALAETGGQPDGYREFLLALLGEEIAFAKPVAYVHGNRASSEMSFLI